LTAGSYPDSALPLIARPFSTDESPRNQLVQMSSEPSGIAARPARQFYSRHRRARCTFDQDRALPRRQHGADSELPRIGGECPVFARDARL